MNILSLDMEHSAMGPMKPWQEGFYISCIGIIRSDGVREVIWMSHSQIPENKQESWWEPDAGCWDRVREHVEWADIMLIHNGKHDATILRYYGISLDNVTVYCTMVAEYILSGQDTRQRTFSLDSVCKHYGLPGKLDKVKALWAKKIDTYDINSDLLTEYVLDDCQKCVDLYARQKPEIERWKLEKVIALQMEFTLSLSDMELYGFDFNTELARKFTDNYEKIMAKHVATIRELAVYNSDPDDEILDPFNPSSNQQISAFLFGGVVRVDGKVWTTRELKCETKYYQKNDKVTISFPGLGFEPPSKKRNADGSVPTDKGTLAKLRGNTPEQKIVLSALTEYSKVKKTKETIKGKTDKKGLINKIQRDGLIHPNLNQCVTVTGRLSGSDPNTQNMPRGDTSPLKECIIPKLDEILQVDLSQVEWRVAAWLSQDPTMMKEINSGIDQHSAACVDLMELPLNKLNRFYAKTFNFRMIYGGVAYGYYMDDNMPNFALYKWEQIVNDFKDKYWRLVDWWTDTYTLVMLQGWYSVPTGRRWVFIKQGHEYPERNVKNYPVQGMAGADILPLLAVQIRRGLRAKGMESHMILTVHDSLVFDVRKSEHDDIVALIAGCIRNLSLSVSRYYGIDFNVRLEGEIEYGSNYGKLGNTIKC